MYNDKGITAASYGIAFNCVVLLSTGCNATEAESPVGDDPASRHTYYSHGVHNDVGCQPQSKCIEERGKDEPSDPKYPRWWISDWSMYRVFNNYKTFPPPYASPPQGLTLEDYEISYGTTYYDSTYRTQEGDGSGAMMEHYRDRCLPIFPISNHFSCSFVSLGDKAYFLRYEDRPKGTPQCCLFSANNHPPRTDFIKHLPYSRSESEHLDSQLQAYSLIVDPTGAGILFGYAFYKEPAPDSYDRLAEAYRHPQSFYFSGSPTTPPDAPIVSQNYISFRMERPDVDKVWGQVAQMCPNEPQWCCLFPGDCPDQSAMGTEPSANWGELKH